MPRAPRNLEIGGVYHIINRGVEKRQIFLKDQDYSRFILGLEFFNQKNPGLLWPLIAKAGSDPAKLGKELKKERAHKSQPIVELLAFALMPNHYHFIVRQIIPGGISSFMHKMGGYVIYFNKQYNRIGPLFQSRYKAVSIKDDDQLSTAFAYVHTNPVELFEPGWKEGQIKNKSQVLARLRDYHWSSFRDYLGMPTFPHAISQDFFLNLYGGQTGCQKIVEDRIDYKAL